MRKNLSPFLRKHLDMLGKGYSNARIAKESGHSEDVINQYTQKLKHYFQDEPELQEGSPYSTKTALLMIGQRYFKEEETNSNEIQLENNLDLSHVVKLNYDSILNIYKNNHQMIHQIGVRGDASLAVESATLAIEEIRKLLSNITEDKYRYPLLELLGRILYVRDTNYTKITSPLKVLDFSKSTAQTMKEIAKECGNIELFGLAEHCLGDAYYIHRRSAIAIPILQNALDVVKNPDEQLRTLRTLALSCVYQNHTGEYKKAETRINDLIESGQCTRLDRVCLAHEGLGRCQGMLGSTEAFNTFQKAYAVISQIKANRGKLPFREVQLRRSELEAMQQLIPQEKDLLEKRGMEALQIAEEYGYQRHIKQIKILLDNSLN